MFMRFFSQTEFLAHSRGTLAMWQVGFEHKSPAQTTSSEAFGYF
jgi:hypothetical protein